MGPFRRRRSDLETIPEDDRYGGIRVHVGAYVGKARDRIQIDVAFGDTVTPEPTRLTYPTMLASTPAPQLKVYPLETVVAEKWEATVSLGETNTRLKDVIDLDDLAGSGPFSGALLQEAVRRTFERRNTGLDPDTVVLSPGYRADEGRQRLWSAARRRYEREGAPERFAVAMQRVIAFIGPPYLAACAGRRFSAGWQPAPREWQK